MKGLFETLTSGDVEITAVSDAEAAPLPVCLVKLCGADPEELENLRETSTYALRAVEQNTGKVEPFTKYTQEMFIAVLDTIAAGQKRRAEMVEQANKAEVIKAGDVYDIKVPTNTTDYSGGMGEMRTGRVTVKAVTDTEVIVSANGSDARIYPIGEFLKLAEKA